MSVHEGGREQAVGKKGGKRSGRVERAFTEFRVCVLNADTAEQTHRLMREEKKPPLSDH